MAMKDTKIVDAAWKTAQLFHEGHHCRGMYDYVPVFLDEERREKAMRWLGFMQGAAWAEGLASIEQLKEWNKPDSEAS